MSLIKHTIIFVVFNAIITTLLVMSIGAIPTDYGVDINLNETSTLSAVGDVRDVTSSSVSRSAFDNASIPSWFTGWYMMIAGVWGLAIIIGWIRGVS